MNDSQQLRKALSDAFAANAALYRNRGFQRRIGYGTRPALLIIDLANAWTRPGNPFTCEGMDEIILGTQRLLTSFRARRLPIVYTTTAYDVIEGPASDMGVWGRKVPLDVLRTGSPEAAIDDRIEPQPGEHVIVKKRASAFHGTHLSGLLKAAGVDTVIVVGVTACCCVRNTAEDAVADGFRPIVVRECVGDRIIGAVEWNLFDIDAKFGDVEPLEDVLQYLRSNIIA
jgi:N-carbamoylsarcosine amidase